MTAGCEPTCSMRRFRGVGSVAQISRSSGAGDGQNGLRSTSKIDFIVTWQPAAIACA